MIVSRRLFLFQLFSTSVLLLCQYGLWVDVVMLHCAVCISMCSCAQHVIILINAGTSHGIQAALTTIVVCSDSEMGVV